MHNLLHSYMYSQCTQLMHEKQHILLCQLAIFFHPFLCSLVHKNATRVQQQDHSHPKPVEGVVGDGGTLSLQLILPLCEITLPLCVVMFCYLPCSSHTVVGNQISLHPPIQWLGNACYLVVVGWHLQHQCRCKLGRPCRQTYPLPIPSPQWL